MTFQSAGIPMPLTWHPFLATLLRFFLPYRLCYLPLLCAPPPFPFTYQALYLQMISKW